MTSVAALVHQDADKKTHDALRTEARAHLAKSPGAQLVAELLTKLRELAPPWWRPDALRKRFPASERMRWLEQRRELRQTITTQLTGLAPKAARSKPAEFQASLIDAVVDEGDIDVVRFETAFDPADLAVYGPAAEYWREFRERMPWSEETQANIDLVAWLLRALMADKSTIEGCARKPIVTAWQVRTAIDGRVWHTRMPLDIRVAIDDARLKQEGASPGQPFHAAQDLAIAVPELIAANIPLKELDGVLVQAERALGFERAKPAAAERESAAPKPTTEGVAAAPAVPAAAAPVVPPPRPSEGGEAPVTVVAPSTYGGSSDPAAAARAAARPSNPPESIRSSAPAPATRPSSRPEPPKPAPSSVRPIASPSARPPEPAATLPRPRSSAPPAAAYVARATRTDPPRVEFPPRPPSRPVMAVTNLLEDDDLEPTNPSVIADEEFMNLDGDTTKGDRTSPGAGGKRSRRG